MPHLSRSEGFDKTRNMTTVFGMTLEGHPYDEELAGPDGMHYHVWVPHNMARDEIQQLLWRLQKEHDVVSMSYDRLAEGETIEPGNTVVADMRSLEAAVDNRSLVVLKWEDGQTMTVDLFSAGALVNVYRALNESNREKIERFVKAGPGALAKVIGIAFKAPRRA